MGDINIQTETSDLLGLPRPAQWNYGNISSDVPLESLEMNSNLVRINRLIPDLEYEKKNPFNKNLLIKTLKLILQAWLVGSLATSILWVVYITFYNSRVVGYFLTKFINRMFMKGCHFKIGTHS